MGQMTTPKPLIIIVWTCQEMMAWIGWMSTELIGSVNVIWWDFGLEVGQITADVCQTPTTNLTKCDSHMGQMTITPKPLIIIIWACQEMMAWIGWMSMVLIGSVDVIWWDFDSEVGQITADVCQTPITQI
jgi:hypothetical protein